MCRFVVYKGAEILMADLITRSRHSLIRQSYEAKEAREPLNGDGFGVGWYVPEVDPTPCVFTSITPAWNNRNLHRLAEKISTPSLFAHVRAASSGMSVSELNCHPFQHGRYLWMHNGFVSQFRLIKRRLRESLSDPFYDIIEGTTDAEHAFALFLENLGDLEATHTPEALGAALRKTIETIEAYTRDAGIAEPSFLNFAITDGQSAVVSRYVTDPQVEPNSLYVSRGDAFACRGDDYRMIHELGTTHAVIVVSEPLTSKAEDWDRIPRDHLVTITPSLDVRFTSLRA